MDIRNEQPLNSTQPRNDQPSEFAEATDINGGWQLSEGNEWIAPTKFCRVCGDKAISYNYGVITCESCKAFFRRHATREKKIKCPFYGKCPTNVRTRKHCQKCRLIKCFQAGMRLEAAQKRRRRNPSDISDCEDGDDDAQERSMANESRCTETARTDASGDIGSIQIADTVSKKACFDNAGIAVSSGQEAFNITIQLPSLDSEDQCVDAGGKLRAVLKAAFQGSPNEEATVESLMRQIGKKASKELVLAPGKRPAEQSSLSEWLAQSKNQRIFDFTFDQAALAPTARSRAGYFPYCTTTFGTKHRDISTVPDSGIMMSLRMRYVRLEELLKASQEARNERYSLQPLHGSGLNDLTIDDYKKIACHMLMYTVSQHRRLAAFKGFPLPDQIALMKARAREVGLMRLMIKCRIDTGETDIGYPGQPLISIDVGKKLRGSFYQEILKYTKGFPNSFRNNENICVLLCAIAFFNPEAIRLAEDAAVDAERDTYLQLLKAYLENTLDERESAWAYKYLTTWVSCVSIWSNWHCARSDFDVDPSTMAVSRVQMDSCFE